MKMQKNVNQKKKNNGRVLCNDEGNFPIQKHHNVHFHHIPVLYQHYHTIYYMHQKKFAKVQNNYFSPHLVNVIDK